MPTILNSPFSRSKQPREIRIATPGEFVRTWLGGVAVFAVLYLAAFKLGMLPSVLRIQAQQTTPL